MLAPKLTDLERMGVVGLSDSDGDFCFRSFKHIAANCPLPPHLVRRTIRRLARKGLARFESGLCTEDGDFYGSGYALTDAGKELVSAVEAVTNLAFEVDCRIRHAALAKVRGEA